MEGGNNFFKGSNWVLILVCKMKGGANYSLGGEGIPPGSLLAMKMMMLRRDKDEDAQDG